MGSFAGVDFFNVDSLFSEEERAVRDTVREWVDDQLIPIIGEAYTNHRFPRFTVSVDYKKGTTTGISAFDRAATIDAMLAPDTKPEDFTKPGHLFPLRYHPGGVLARAGHTEAIIDLCNLMGMYPAGIVCEIMNDDGTMARMDSLEKFGKTHDLKILSIAQIIAHRRRHEKLVERVAEARLPTKYGEFTAIAFRSPVDPGE